jgi:hypothetical protein
VTTTSGFMLWRPQTDSAGRRAQRAKANILRSDLE